MKTFFACVLAAVIGYMIVTSNAAESSSSDIPIGEPDQPAPKASAEKRSAPANSAGTRKQKSEEGVLPAPLPKPTTPAPIPFRQGNTIYT